MERDSCPMERGINRRRRVVFKGIHTSKQSRRGRERVDEKNRIYGV